MARHLPLLSLAAASLAVAACGSAEAGSGVTVRDSAGVRIVESRAPAADAASTWRVDDAPAVQIGVAEGAPEYQLSGVRGTLRLTDGTVVVADGHSRELRFYDAGGRFVRATGGPGGGPGEFQGLNGMVAYRGDSLAVWDMGPRRISVFGPDGTLGRTATVQGVSSLAARLNGALDDGSFVLGGVGSLEDYLRTDAGERRDSVTYLRIAADGAFGDTLARQAAQEYVSAQADNRIMLLPILFGRGSYVAAGGGRTYVAESDLFRIDALEADGTPVLSIRRPGELRQPGRDEVARARRAAADAREKQRSAGGVPAGGPAPEVPERPTVPAFDRLLVDTQGQLWVREFLVSPDDAPRWSVFDAQGERVATVRTPAGLEIQQIGPDWIVGVGRDELDVESVRVHRLARGGEHAAR